MSQTGSVLEQRFGQTPVSRQMLQTCSVLDRLLSADRLTDVTARQRFGQTTIRQTDRCALDCTGFAVQCEWTVTARLRLQQQPPRQREEAAVTVHH